MQKKTFFLPPCTAALCCWKSWSWSCNPSARKQTRRYVSWDYLSRLEFGEVVDWLKLILINSNHRWDWRGNDEDEEILEWLTFFIFGCKYRWLMSERSLLKWEKTILQIERKAIYLVYISAFSSRLWHGGKTNCWYHMEVNWKPVTRLLFFFRTNFYLFRGRHWLKLQLVLIQF